MRKYRVDPFIVTILERRIHTICEEMCKAYERTGLSPLTVLIRDFGVGITDDKARNIGVAQGVPIHSLGNYFAVTAVKEAFKDELYPGDEIIVNDPYSYNATSHLPDWCVVMPIFHKDKIEFFSSVRGHQIDTGGSVVGGYNPGATDIFTEGLRITPIKITEKGNFRKDIFKMICENTRVPHISFGDTQAMLGAGRIGVKRMAEVIEKFGVQTVKDACDDMYELTADEIARRLSEIPDGFAAGESISDGDPYGGPYTIRVEITKKGDKMTVDFSKSDPPTKGGMNSSYQNTVNHALIVLYQVFGYGLPPCTSSLLEHIQLIIPKGTILHAEYPAPVSMCTTLTGWNITNALAEALAYIYPERCCAPSSVGPLSADGGIDPRTGLPYVTNITIGSLGGSGARQGLDGLSHAPSFIGGMCKMGSVEMTERACPLLVLKNEWIKDSCGHGKWRGGPGIEWEIMNEAAGRGNVMTFLGEYKYAPKGVYGGTEGSLTEHYIIKKDGIKFKVPMKGPCDKDTGDILVALSSGGGGWDNPLERDIEKVQNNVIDELISVETARKYYGVIIDPKTFEVDYESTKKLRERLKAI